MRILDVGCAGGVAFDDWSRFGEIWGIEPDPGLARSTPKWSARVRRASLEELEPPGDGFDLIIMLDVLEHIEDDRAALHQLAELLTPEGRLLITVPALPILWSIHDEANAHYRRYRRSELKSRLEEAGFEPLMLRFFFGWSFGLVLLRRLLARPGRPYVVRIPPAPINRLLETFCRAEQGLDRILGLSPPIGSSLIAVATAAGNGKG